MIKCRICGRGDIYLDHHHVVPVQDENTWGKAYNRRRILDQFGFGLKEYTVFLCKRCHWFVQEWLRDSRNMLFERECDLCGKNILIGHDGDLKIAFGLDGQTFHYDSAGVQIETFQKNS
jgi:hypothetical protein